MVSSLSNIVNNLAEGIHEIKFKYGHDSDTCGIKYKYFKFCLEYTNAKDKLVLHKCLFYNKNYQKFFDEILK